MFTHTFCRNLPHKFTAEQTARAVRLDEKGKLAKKKKGEGGGEREEKSSVCKRTKLWFLFIL